MTQFKQKQESLAKSNWRGEGVNLSFFLYQIIIDIKFLGINKGDERLVQQKPQSNNERNFIKRHK